MTIRALILLGLLAFILWLKISLFDWEPAHPVNSSTAQVNSPREVDLTKQSYSFTWQPRSGERPAPPLAMRIEPTDVYAWWWTGGRNSRRLLDTGNGPQKLVLDLQVPSADAFPSVPAEGLCVDSEAPFMGCRVALSRIVLERDDVDWDLVDGLLGKRLLPTSTDFVQRITDYG